MSNQLLLHYEDTNDGRTIDWPVPSERLRSMRCAFCAREVVATAFSVACAVAYPAGYLIVIVLCWCIHKGLCYFTHFRQNVRLILR